ncbi:hypothetical protein SODALDRAFT_170440 [Sodiomyces alkalinus F11]|uniref:Uncharacterized protein n=1 Tax=Sodiomyces alkalinus (strain CBS 110278 / VKM F-3762 / F11) TaxID=1314773 RepID=A0A3N2PWA2_SODAK|nr:hypothetical protein SODALDRAFT_170440 [Sodiomyces alkalinus F11]ROT38762.1 hypothetical protein SODALDRAFT_170440 [Sodiomyces alkalinus F11]
MAPDINPLPNTSSTFSIPLSGQSAMSSANGDASSSAVSRGDSPAGSPRSMSTSLQAAATLNAGLQREWEPVRRSSSSSLSRQRSPSASRRRSTVLMNLQHNDPAVPGPGELVSENQRGRRGSFVAAVTGSPQLMSGSPRLSAAGSSQHHRTLSLGELHQELEAEQEAQVNRLLQTIRQQQVQLQQAQGQQGGSGSAAADDSPIMSERSNQGTPAPQWLSNSQSQSATPSLPAGSFSRSPGPSHHPRSSFDIARADIQRRSRTPSRGVSPRVRSGSISGESDQWTLGRDEAALYQAETQMLIRENQMLRHRMRDLERQLGELGGPVSGSHGNPNEPVFASSLVRSTTVDDDESSPAQISTTERTAAAVQSTKS